ncbi:hypothetical protein Purlil1_14074 [Purpureocillium lilacinum]|uniref:Zn(2)-C6 fungal-type domain-containing protein n=1 Tax=Purpureocillium lilacinum TaxID=33203 RepID=A0ABR0BCA9_PURLI|nr:hypothetical protein Purlil1_14074 [Purpureocillium lilacinum]
MYSTTPKHGTGMVHSMLGFNLTDTGPRHPKQQPGYQRIPSRANGQYRRRRNPIACNFCRQRKVKRDPRQINTQPGLTLVQIRCACNRDTANGRCDNCYAKNQRCIFQPAGGYLKSPARDAFRTRNTPNPQARPELSVEPSSAYPQYYAAAREARAHPPGDRTPATSCNSSMCRPSGRETVTNQSTVFTGTKRTMFDPVRAAARELGETEKEVDTGDLDGASALVILAEGRNAMPRASVC